MPSKKAAPAKRPVRSFNPFQGGYTPIEKDANGSGALPKPPIGGTGQRVLAWPHNPNGRLQSERGPATELIPSDLSRRT